MSHPLTDDQLADVSAGLAKSKSNPPMTERPHPDPPFRPQKKGPIRPEPVEEKPVDPDEPRKIPTLKF